MNQHNGFSGLDVKVMCSVMSNTCPRSLLIENMGSPILIFLSNDNIIMYDNSIFLLLDNMDFFSKGGFIGRELKKEEIFELKGCIEKYENYNNIRKSVRFN